MTARKPTAQRRKEIADAAIKIIGEKGLREFTAAQLAREVGIKDGTIFRHFKDMNEISWAVLDRLQELLEVPACPSKEPMKKLEHFVFTRLHSVVSNAGVQSLLFSDQLSHVLGSEGAQRIAELRNQGRQFVKDCLCEAKEKGLLREAVDVDGAVLLVTGMVMGFLFAKKDGALLAPVEEMERRCWQTLCSVLTSHPGNP